MSAPFKVGDVVVCVDDSACVRPHVFGEPFPIKRGTVLRVAAVRLDCHETPCLRFTAGPKPRGPGYVAARFQHLPKADEQFTAQMRAIKPVRKSVSV